MVDDPQAVVFPYGLEEEYPDGPPSVVVTHKGCRLVLRFAPGDFQGKGDILELRVLPDDPTELKVRTLRQFVPQAELYLKYARTALRIFAPVKPGSPMSRAEQFRSAAEALRRGTGPGKGLTYKFYEAITDEYLALVEGGEPHPVKTIAANHNVGISASSKWIKDARRLFPRRFPPKEAKSNAR